MPLPSHHRWLLLALPLLVAGGCFDTQTQPTTHLTVRAAGVSPKPVASATPGATLKNPAVRPVKGSAATPAPRASGGLLFPSPWPSPVPSYPTLAAQPVSIIPPDDPTLGLVQQNLVVVSAANVPDKASYQLGVVDAGQPTGASPAPPVPTPGLQLFGLTDPHLAFRAFEAANVTPYLAAHPPTYHLAAQAQPLAVGATLPFWVITNFDTANYQDVQVTARVAQVGQHCYVLIDKQVDKTPADAAALEAKAKAIATTFDTGIYPTDTRIFGAEPNPGIDNDPRVFILLSPAVGNYGQDNTLGFFSQRDEFAPQPTSPPIFKHSNQKEMLYISSRIVLTGAADDYLGTIAHEFQHMINFNQKVLVARNRQSEDVWIDEGMAMYAIEANGYGLKAGGQVLANHVKHFQQDPTSYSLTDWPNNPEQSAYGAVYLFMVYLADRFGEAIIHDIVTNDKIGIPNLDYVLAPRGTAFNRVFHDWCMTNVIDPIPENNLANYQYGQLRMIGANGKTRLSGFTTESLEVPANQALNPRPYTMRVFELPQGELTPRFTITGGQDAQAVPRLILEGAGAP